MARTKILVASARVRRIARFVDQLGLFIASRAIESNLPTTPIEHFTNEIFHSMVDDAEEFELLELLVILTNVKACEDVFQRYRKRMTNA